MRILLQHHPLLHRVSIPSRSPIRIRRASRSPRGVVQMRPPQKRPALCSQTSPQPPESDLLLQPGVVPLSPQPHDASPELLVRLLQLAWGPCLPSAIGLPNYFVPGRVLTYSRPAWFSIYLSALLQHTSISCPVCFITSLRRRRQILPCPRSDHNPTSRLRHLLSSCRVKSQDRR
jgi:hypothetical protein